MSDVTPILRQWQLLKSLSARRAGLTVKQIADEARVSQKTIRRDLDLFREIGFPLEEIVAEHGRKQWRIGGTWTEPQSNFTFDEAVALYMARQFLEPLAGTPFWRASQNAFAKIRSSLSDSVIKYLARMSDKLHHTTVGAGDYSHKEELIDQLMLGIEDGRAVFITYQSLRSTEPVTYDIFPYGITIHFGSLYLIGYHTDAKEVRTWKVDRIEGAEVTAFPFKRPKDFQLSAYFSGSFGVYSGRSSEDIVVIIRFAPAVVRYVQESRWHASQQLTPQKDGGLIAEFRLSSTEEIMRWILSFGSHAVVMEPEELCARMREEVAAIAEAYQPLVGKGVDNSC